MTEYPHTQFFDLSQITNEAFDALAKDGYIVIDSFLDEAKCSLLTDYIAELRQNSLLKTALIGRNTSLTHQPQIRGDLTHWLDPHSSHEIEIKLNQDFAELRKILSRELFLPLKKFEGHFALYPPGAGYDMHYDQHKNQPHRLMTFVLYLNTHWNLDCGGELVLFDKDEKELKKISPTLGKLILFQSSLFPHAVLPSTRDRQSLTGWFRNDS